MPTSNRSIGSSTPSKSTDHGPATAPVPDPRRAPKSVARQVDARVSKTPRDREDLSRKGRLERSLARSRGRPRHDGDALTPKGSRHADLIEVGSAMRGWAIPLELEPAIEIWCWMRRAALAAALAVRKRAENRPRRSRGRSPPGVSPTAVSYESPASSEALPVLVRPQP